MKPVKKKGSGLSIEEQFYRAHLELQDTIKLMGATAKAKLLGDLPKQFNIQSVDIVNNEGWLVGFTRCLVEVQKLAKVPPKTLLEESEDK